MPVFTSIGLALGATAATAFTAGATAVGLGLTAISTAAGLLSSGGEVNIPKAEVPAVAASGARRDTGAQVKLGVTDIKDARVSGSRTSGPKAQTIDPLGGLGRGGLAV